MKHVRKGKGVTGPGGIRCACCTKGRPSVMKKLTSRYIRKQSKKELAYLTKRVIESGTAIQRECIDMDELYFDDFDMHQEEHLWPTIEDEPTEDPEPFYDDGDDMFETDYE